MRMNVQQEVQISLTVLITGLVVVFLMLIFLTLIIKGYGNAVHSIQSRHDQKQLRDARPLPEFEPVRAAEPAEGESPLRIQAGGEGIPDEVLAVLAAAASSAIPGGVVSSVRRAAAPDFGRSSWKIAGLLENTRPF